MKLHLPNMLRKALLAVVGIAGSTAYSMEIRQWNAVDLTSATKTDGILTLNCSSSMIKFGVTPDWDLENEVDLIYVSSSGNSWGFMAEGSGDISARATSGKYTADNNSADAAVGGVITQQALVGEVDEVPSVSLIADFRGTALYAPGGSSALYSENTLRYSSDTITTLSFNEAYISSVYTLDTVNSITNGESYLVSNSSGSWMKDFSTSNTKFVYGSDLGGGENGRRMKLVSADALAGMANVVVGKNNQLFIQTWSDDNCTANIVLNQDVYLGSTSLGAAIRFGMDNFDVTMSGDIYLVENAKMQGSNPNQHVINLTGKLTDKVAGEAGVVDTNSVLTLSGGKYNLSGEVDLHGITVEQGIVNVSGKVDLDVFTAASGTTVGLTGGNLSIKSGVSAISGTLISEASGKGLTVGVDSEQTAILSVNRMEMGNIASGSGHDFLTINEGSLLKVTGSQNTDSGQAFKSRSIVLGEWNQKTQLNVYGSMFSQNAVAFAGIKGVDINIGASGILAVQGLSTARPSDTGSALKLTLNDGGSLILGSEGISASTVNPDIRLGAGVVGMFADSTTIGAAISLQSAAGTVFDTSKYAFAEDGNSISRLGGDAVGNMVISGAISGSGKLVTAGGGSVSITGSMSGFSGLIEVGTNSLLSISAADGNMGLGGTIVNNGTLELNRNLLASDGAVFDMYSLSSDGFASSITGVEYAVSQGGNVTLKDGAVIYLGADDTVGASLSIKDENIVTFQGDASGLESNVYYVSSTTATASGITVPEGQTLDHIHVVASGKLTIDAGSDASNILATTTGSGTLELTIGATLGHVSTVFDGDVRVVGGVTLTLGQLVDNQANANGTADVSSLRSIILDGGNLVYQGTTGTIQGITALSDADFSIFDMTHDTNNEGHTLSVGKLSVASGKTLTVNRMSGGVYKHRLDIGQLSGAGNLAIYGPGDTTWGEGKISRLLISSMKEFSGNLSIVSREGNGEGNVYHAVVNTGADGATLGNLSFAGFGESGERSSATFNVEGDTSVKALSAASATVNISEGKTLTLGSADEASTSSIGTLTGGAGSKLNLTANATLNSISSGSGVKLTGSGKYELGSGNTDANVTGLNSADWTGTVKLSGISNANGLNFSNYGNVSSKVELDGVSGWFARVANDAVGYNTHVVLTGAGLTMTGYSTNESYKFNKGISGSGDFIINGTSEASPNVKIGANTGENADLKWSGAFKVNSVGDGRWVNLELKDAGSYFDAATAASGVQMNSTETLNVYTGNASGGTTIINGAIVNNGTKNEAGETDYGTLNVTVQGDTEFSKNVTATNLNVDSGKTATLTGEANSMVIGNATITSKAGTDAALSNVTIDAPDKKNTISATSTANGTKGSISNADVQIAQLAEDASFTIQDMTLTNTTITAATTETRVNLSNVSASNLALATGKFTMNAAPVVGLGGTEATFNTGVSSLAAGAATLTLNLDMMAAYESTGAVSGATLTITLGVSGADFSSYTVENWQALVGFDGWLGTTLENQNATYQVADGAAQVSEGASTPAVSYGYTAGGGGGNVGTLVITISGLNVPEPASATLGLAALMMLCARRRRKA